jgi:hypothetical protein
MRAPALNPKTLALSASLLCLVFHFFLSSFHLLPPLLSPSSGTHSNPRVSSRRSTSVHDATASAELGHGAALPLPRAAAAAGAGGSGRGGRNRSRVRRIPAEVTLDRRPSQLDGRGLPLQLLHPLARGDPVPMPLVLPASFI